MDKNINVELLRIFLTVAVCLHHFRLYSDALPYGGGYIAVDCFFIICGYYMARHIMEKRSEIREGSLQYIYKRYIRLFPEYFLAFLIAFIFRAFAGEIPSGHWWGYVREALMIEFWCVDSVQRINPPDWYCGYLLLASVVIYEYIKWMRGRIGLIYMTGIAAAGLYAILMFHSNDINIYPQYRCVLSVAILRAFAGLLLGCFVYLLDRRTCDIIISYYKKRVSYIVIAFLIMGVAYILLWENSWLYIDYVAIVLFVFLFLIAVKIKINYSACFCHIVECVGMLCYSIYLNHYLVAFIFNKYRLCKMLDWKVTSFIYLIVVCVFSGGVFLFEKALVAFCQRIER